MSFLDQLITNWETYAGVFAAFILLFDRVAKLTPTESDNKIVKTLYRVSAFLGVKVKDNPGGNGNA